MTAILGISAFYHDAAAALIVDGDIVAAAQEERFTRRKHDPEFPTQAIQSCLDQAGLVPEDLDYVGFYDKPLLKFDRLLETYLAFAPRGFKSFVESMPIWLRKKLHLSREIHKGLDGRYKKRIVFAEHHESHAASAFFPSRFDEAVILTLDGVGEWATASIATGKGNRVEIQQELHFPHSIGLLYSAFTYFCGFRVNFGEYKLMGLAPYGEPRYVDTILENLMDLKEDGSFRLDLSYFNYCQGLTMTSPKFDALFGRPPRPAESDLTQQDMDLAASVQKVTEEVMLRSARHAHELTGIKNLCLAGGVALNCVGNGRLLREGPFDDVWIQPAAGDAGGALGVASLIWYQLLDNPRTAVKPDQQAGSLLGPAFSTEEIKTVLDADGATYRQVTDEAALLEEISTHLQNGKVVGHMQGRMEFGPRALGSRSIIGDARDQRMQRVMNLKIKYRESFRPFAPVVLHDHASEIFEMAEGVESPYMLVVAPVQESLRLESDGQALEGLDKLHAKRSTLPAITHVDYSARVQTVDPGRHGRFHRLMAKFHEDTGCPVLVNTSFNIRGEPIVCTPADAWRCFMGTEMDVLVIEDFILLKEEQDKDAHAHGEAYQAQFQLD